MMKNHNIYILIPAFNEADVIGEIIRDLFRRYPSQHVVVVDDASPDRTSDEAALAGATVLRHLINLGQGAALQTGIDYALREGADILVTFDADGQHRVEDVEALITPIMKGECDVMIGSRFLGTTENMPFMRRIILKLSVWLTRWTTGFPFTDSHNGFRAFTRKVASSLQITQNRMAHASQILDQFIRQGCRIQEVPVCIRYTEYSKRKGQSTMNVFNILADLVRERFFR